MVYLTESTLALCQSFARVFLRTRWLHSFVAILIWVGVQACSPPAKLTHVIIGQQPISGDEVTFVHIDREGKPEKTMVPMDLKEKDLIKTDSKATAVLTFLTETGDTIARVMLRPDTQVRISSLEVIYGQILVIIKRLEGIFEVKTEDVTAGPSSTEFVVSKKHEGGTVVSVLKGAVTLTSPVGAWPSVKLSQSKIATVLAGARPEIGELEPDAYNDIVEWANAVERAVNPKLYELLVPDMQGQPEPEARRLLERQGLSVGKIEPRISGQNVPLGTVVYQEPSPGTRVKPGRTIDIGVEVEPVPVPDLRRKPLREVKRILRESRLEVGKVERRITGRQPAETIIDQRPEAGVVVPETSAVDLVVEEESVVVPDVRRLLLEEAKTALRRGRLRLGGIDEELSGCCPAGTVLDQSPPAEKRVRPGTSVHITIVAESYIVPNVRGLSLREGKRILRTKHLRVGRIEKRITGDEPPGTILRQYLTQGRRVRPDTQVDLVVEAVSVKVPDIKGLSLSKARRVLQRLDLRLARQDEKLTERYRPGTVIDQSPDPRRLVAPGTYVDITVALEGRRVPNLFGRSKSRASRLLRNRELRLGDVSYKETQYDEPGTVIKQNPSKGKLVERNTAVHVVIARKPKCEVPDVEGLREREARREIRNAGLIPRNASENVKTGDSVERQSPSYGARKTCGSTVRYYLEREVRTCTVPYLRRGTTHFKEVIRKIERAGFVAINRTPASRTGDDWYLDRLEPKGGTRGVPCGSYVEFYLERRRVR